MDARTAKILTRAHFANLISLSAPDADAEALRMGVDWCIWVSAVLDMVAVALREP